LADSVAQRRAVPGALTQGRCLSGLQVMNAL
jgi:hypothetical protein